MDARSHREKLTQALSGGLIVVSAHDQMQLAGDMAAPFLQESNFFWLTGITLPGWKVIIDGTRRHVTLVRPTRSRVEEIFDGVIDDISLLNTAAADEIIDANEFENYLRKLAKHHPLVYTPYHPESYSFIVNPAPGNLFAVLERIFTNTVDCTKQLAELRAIKSDEEIAMMRKAIKLTTDAFKSVRQNLDSYRYEYEIEADMTQHFRRNNATHAYEPIIAAGAHAVTLHYTANNASIARQRMVLIDVGARVGGYSADITRTYCTHPTKRQREIHAAVKEAHQRIIALLKPDLPVAEYIAEVDEIMKDALSGVKLLKDRNDIETYRKYFPHAISHGLGIDPHDNLGSPRYFKPGMVVTVEPGIYIPEEGIGVRIEDDILITKTGHENLSRTLPTSL